MKKCDMVYLEAYTSVPRCGKEALEQFYDKHLMLADKDLVEHGADEILENSQNKDVAFLVVGATTHTDIFIRAKEKDIEVGVLHNASILNAVGCCGLQLYSFSETVSIPYWTNNWDPDSFFDKISNNYKNNLHTLCLLDIKDNEPTFESSTKKKREYLSPKFMTVSRAS